MVGENGFGEMKALILTKLEEHTGEVKELQKAMGSLTLAFSEMKTIKMTCSANVTAELDEIRATAVRANQRVDGLELQLDRAKTSASAVRTALVVVATVIGSGGALWAWVHSHFTVAPK